MEEKVSVISEFSNEDGSAFLTHSCEKCGHVLIKDFCGRFSGTIIPREFLKCDNCGVGFKTKEEEWEEEYESRTNFEY